MGSWDTCREVMGERAGRALVVGMVQVVMVVVVIAVAVVLADEH